MQQPLPDPTAQGSFAKTPLPHLLVYALERRLSGSFELYVDESSVATMLVIQGFPAKVRLGESLLHLGELMLELGMITPDQLKTSLERLQESPRLQGQILKELGAVDDAALEAALRTQVERKIEHLFSLPEETTYAYFDGLDLLQRYGGSPTAIDALPVLWRGVRQSPAWEHVDATLRKVGTMAVQIAAGAQIDRFQFSPDELQAIDFLRQRPARVVDLATSKLVSATTAQLLVYFLVITKQVELLDASALPPPSLAPVAPPPPAPPPPAPVHPSGQAFARVQLQPRQVARAPLVIEEVTPLTADTRASIPLRAAPPPADAPAGDAEVPPAPRTASDIGALIASSLPPAPTSGRAGSSPLYTAPSSPAIPAAPRVPSDVGAAPASGSMSARPMSSGSVGAMPAAGPVSGPSPVPAAPPRLTAEQNALKAKILERAEKITSQDYFQMLGLDKEATTEAVQKAFIALAKVWHPDRLPPALVDVQDACSKVFAHLTEAHQTLTDPKRRASYMNLMKDGGATPDDQAKIQSILEAATEFQKAEILMKRNLHDPQVFDLVKRAVSLDPEQVEYLALYTWLEAQQPQWQSKEKTMEKIVVLDRCIQKSPKSERAYFYRAMLWKRIDQVNRSVKDFKMAAELNPRNLDAVREVRLYRMRGGSKPPPAMTGSGTGGSVHPSKPPPAEKPGGLFGKLFKKS